MNHILVRHRTLDGAQNNLRHVVFCRHCCFLVWSLAQYLRFPWFPGRQLQVHKDVLTAWTLHFQDAVLLLADEGRPKYHRTLSWTSKSFAEICIAGSGRTLAASTRPAGSPFGDVPLKCENKREQQCQCQFKLFCFVVVDVFQGRFNEH